MGFFILDENQTWPEVNQVDLDYVTSVDTNVAILQTVVCLVALPLGILLVYGIVLYEHFGVDSQKRSIFNQLISATFSNGVGLAGLTGVIPITIRCWTGPLGHVFGMIVAIGRRFAFANVLVLVVEILIYKNLCIISPNFILRLNDDFWVTLILVWNCVFVLGLTNVSWISSSTHPRIYLFISGCGDLTSATEDRKMFLALWLIIVFLAFFYMIIRLIKNPSIEPQQPHQSHLNNAIHNPALVNNLQILLVVFIFVLVAIPGMFMTNKGPDGFILGFLPGVVAALMVVPGLFYAFNANLRKFVVREAREAIGLKSNVIQDIESIRHSERF